MILYNIGVRVYGGIVRSIAPFNKKAKLWAQGRKDIFARLEKAIAKEDRIVWIHCASLGEFEQGRPIIEAVKAQHPEYKILLTFYSPSGYEIRKGYEGADYIFYLPDDTPANARRFMSIAHPEITIFVKYEFWLNYLDELKNSNCRTFIISAIFRRDSVFFKSYGGMFRRALGTFERFFVQSDESKALLAELNFGNATVAGDTRFDRVAAIAGAAKKLDIAERFATGSKVFVAGSTWPADEELIIKLIENHPDIKFIIAPHEMDQTRIDKFISDSPQPTVRYTQCTAQTDLQAARILMVDTIGILSSVYQYADYGYIGGGFGVGIHNTLEAATFGLPITFGPNYGKFREARELIEIGAAQSIAEYGELDRWLTELISDPDTYAQTKAKALSYIAANTGATAKIMDHIFRQ